MKFSGVLHARECVRCWRELWTCARAVGASCGRVDVVGASCGRVDVVGASCGRVHVVGASCGRVHVVDEF